MYFFNFYKKRILGMYFSKDLVKIAFWDVLW